jgi:histidyl-tRNA synthetase
MKITSIKGFADILPGEVETWRFVEEKAREVFALYNFAEIRLPIVEKTELFSRSLGETTDIVEKEMYTFADHDAKGTL